MKVKALEYTVLKNIQKSSKEKNKAKFAAVYCRSLKNLDLTLVIGKTANGYQTEHPLQHVLSWPSLLSATLSLSWLTA